MECRFEPGQRVVCIDDDWNALVPDVDLGPAPRAGEIVAVAELVDYEGVVYLGLKGFEGAYEHRAFAPLAAREPDISVFTRLLADLPTAEPRLPLAERIDA